MVLTQFAFVGAARPVVSKPIAAPAKRNALPMVRVTRLRVFCLFGRNVCSHITSRIKDRSDRFGVLEGVVPKGELPRVPAWCPTE